MFFLAESPTEFPDNSIDDPIFQPHEKKDCSSEQSGLTDEPTSSTKTIYPVIYWRDQLKQQ